VDKEVHFVTGVAKTIKGGRDELLLAEARINEVKVTSCSLQRCFVCMSQMPMVM
jgi:hypothetical protein